MHHHGQHFAEWLILPQVLLSLPFILLFIFYMAAVIKTNHAYKKWPMYRSVFLCIGAILAVMSVAGPLAELSHTDFRAHMAGHLLLGMLVPLLIALAAPMTLLLRTLPTSQARWLTKLLKSRPIGWIINPITAAILNIGGLWLLYTTSLYSLMHEIMWLHVLVHMHIFLAGYLFTVSLIYIDPIHHRVSYLNRAIVLVLSLACIVFWLNTYMPILQMEFRQTRQRRARCLCIMEEISSTQLLSSSSAGNGTGQQGHGLHLLQAHMHK